LPFEEIEMIKLLTSSLALGNKIERLNFCDLLILYSSTTFEKKDSKLIKELLLLRLQLKKSCLYVKFGFISVLSDDEFASSFDPQAFNKIIINKK
jgi:hypothetical protein